MLKITRFKKEVLDNRMDVFSSIVSDASNTGIPSDVPTVVTCKYQETDASWWLYSLDAAAWLPLNGAAKTLYDA